MRRVLLAGALAAAAFAQQPVLPLSVDVASDHIVTIRASLDPDFHAFVVYGMIFGGEPRYDDRFQKSDLRGPEFRRVLKLNPGRYTVLISARNLDGEGRRASATFTVK